MQFIPCEAAELHHRSPGNSSWRFWKYLNIKREFTTAVTEAGRLSFSQSSRKKSHCVPHDTEKWDKSVWNLHSFHSEEDFRPFWDEKKIKGNNLGMIYHRFGANGIFSTTRGTLRPPLLSASCRRPCAHASLVIKHFVDEAGDPICLRSRAAWVRGPPALSWPGITHTQQVLLRHPLCF